jgi:hypothetical protein
MGTIGTGGLDGLVIGTDYNVALYDFEFSAVREGFAACPICSGFTTGVHGLDEFDESEVGHKDECPVAYAIWQASLKEAGLDPDTVSAGAAIEARRRWYRRREQAGTTQPVSAPADTQV